jgi:arylsulfatase A-like enzyme
LVFPRDFTGGRKLSPQEIQSEIDGYDASLAYLDAEIGSLMDKLRAVGLLDKTLVIITSDHGESFGNHGLFGHGNSLFRDLLHVPLIIRLPGKAPTGLRVSNAVGLETIPATVIDLLGFGAELPFPGRSLAEHWAKGRPDALEDGGSAFAESLPGIVRSPAYPLGRRGAMKSLTTSKWHLIVNEEGHVELFQVETDAQELDNLAYTSKGREVMKDLGPKIARLMTPEDWKVFQRIVDSCPEALGVGEGCQRGSPRVGE